MLKKNFRKRNFDYVIIRWVSYTLYQNILIVFFVKGEKEKGAIMSVKMWPIFWYSNFVLFLFFLQNSTKKHVDNDVMLICCIFGRKVKGVRWNLLKIHFFKANCYEKTVNIILDYKM